MTKDDIAELFKNQLVELDDFKLQIIGVESLINKFIEHFELLDDDITDEQITDIFSDINVKSSKLNSIIFDIKSDSKKLESFLNQVKLLKFKRDEKLKKYDDDDDDKDMYSIFSYVKNKMRK